MSAASESLEQLDRLFAGDLRALDYKQLREVLVAAVKAEGELELANQQPNRMPRVAKARSTAIELRAKGLTYRAIAKELGLKKSTVYNYVNQ